MNEVLGCGIALTAPVLFYSYIFWILKKTNAIQEIKAFKKLDLIIPIFIILGITAFMGGLIRQNHFIYYWDYGREWTTALSVSNELLTAPLEAVKSIYTSINNTDYNRFMPLLIVLPLKIFGCSFNRYVVINTFFYLCPALLMISLLAYKILRKFSVNKTSFWNVMLFVSATPIFYSVILDGFMDGPILLLISGLLMVSLEYDFRRVDFSVCIQITIGLLLLVLFRRHFAYWVVGYMISILFTVLHQPYIDKDSRRRTFKIYIMDMLLIGGISLAVLLTVFRQFFIRSVFNNFSYAYSAYNVSYADKFWRIVVVFGWGILFLAFILSPIVSMYYKGIKTILFSYVINIAVAAFLLWRELQMNWHQYYLIVIQVILLACIGLFGLAERMAKKKEIVIRFMGVTLAVVNMAVCFMPALKGVKVCNLFSTRYYEAKVRNDLENIDQMIMYVNEIANQENGKWVYVLSSSGILNSDVLRKAKLPFNMNPIPNLYGTKEVDLRDGFPEELFYADIVIVANPVQTHLPEEKQQIISYLSKLITDSDSYLGRHYEIIKKFTLDGGVVANIYMRNSHYSREDYRKLQQYFDGLYGDYPELFHDLLEYPSAFFPEEVGKKLVLTNQDHILGTNCAKSTDNFVSTAPGHLVYGPGKRIEKGVYDITFEYECNENIKTEEPLGVVDVCLSLNVIASENFYAGNTQVKLNNVKIDDPDDKCELRMYVNMPGIEFQSVTVEKVK